MSAIHQLCAVQICNDTGQDIDLLWGCGRRVWWGSPSHSHDPQRDCCPGGCHSTHEYAVIFFLINSAINIYQDQHETVSSELCWWCSFGRSWRRNWPRVNLAYHRADFARASFVNDARICGTNFWRDLTRACQITCVFFGGGAAATGGGGGIMYSRS